MTTEYLWQIRCVECGKPIENFRKKYIQLRKEGKTADEALNAIGFYRPCCRKNMLMPYIIPFPQTVPVAKESGEEALTRNFARLTTKDKPSLSLASPLSAMRGTTNQMATPSIGVGTNTQISVPGPLSKMKLLPKLQSDTDEGTSEQSGETKQKQLIGPGVTLRTQGEQLPQARSYYETGHWQKAGPRPGTYYLKPIRFQNIQNLLSEQPETLEEDFGPAPGVAALPIVTPTTQEHISEMEGIEEVVEAKGKEKVPEPEEPTEVAAPKKSLRIQRLPRLAPVKRPSPKK
jgi:DNA-directed RNA polymerase subunit N (RpoN/RPB10)